MIIDLDQEPALMRAIVRAAAARVDYQQASEAMLTQHSWAEFSEAHDRFTDAKRANELANEWLVSMVLLVMESAAGTASANN